MKSRFVHHTTRILVWFATGLFSSLVVMGAVRMGLPVALPRAETRTLHASVVPTPPSETISRPVDAPIGARHARAQVHNGSTCPSDMVLVHGSYCPNAQQECVQWADGGRRRCLRFEQPSECRGRREEKNFCMDTYEWPNHAGEKPTVMVTWVEASAMCAQKGKRLCTQDEWTFACEGDQMLPYPYGYDRDATACTIDHRAAAPNRRLMHSRDNSVAMAEVERVYEASPSGSMPQCKSPFGAMDLTGNVDEWTINESGHPYRSALKGGWWGRVRTRCRPATLAHYEHFRYYQIGFRCCAEAQ